MRALTVSGDGTLRAFALPASGLLSSALADSACVRLPTALPGPLYRGYLCVRRRHVCLDHPPRRLSQSRGRRFRLLYDPGLRSRALSKDPGSDSPERLKRGISCAYYQKTHFLCPDRCGPAGRRLGGPVILGGRAVCRRLAGEIRTRFQGGVLMDETFSPLPPSDSVLLFQRAASPIRPLSLNTSSSGDASVLIPYLPDYGSDLSLTVPEGGALASFLPHPGRSGGDGGLHPCRPGGVDRLSPGGRPGGAPDRAAIRPPWRTPPTPAVRPPPPCCGRP